MRGVKYLYNEHGKKAAVLIDLQSGGALWEDLLDAALAECRENEPTVSWTSVRSRLERASRLKPVR